jgi:hypothetical protein
MDNHTSTVCNGHGDYYDNACNCDWGWFGSSCSEKGVDLWNTTEWNAFIVLYTILYFIILLTSLVNLYAALTHDKIIGISRLLYSLIRSPKNLCLLFLTCIGLLRVMWLLYDPFRFNNKLSRTQERLVYETVFPFIYGIYSSVLLVWGGLYQGMRSTSSDPFKILRKFIMGMMVLAFPASFTFSVLKGYRVNPDDYTLVSIIFGGVAILIVIIGFTIFGILLIIYIETNIRSPETFFPDKLPSIDSNFEIKIDDCSTRRIEKTRLSLKSMTELPMSKDNSCWDSYLSHNTIDEYKKIELFHYSRKSLTPKKKKSKESLLIYIITKDDKIVFRKITILFTLSIIFGICALVLFGAINSKVKDDAFTHELGLIYGVFSIEIFGCFVIYLVFTTQIKVKDKNYLRFFSSLSLSMNNKIPKIKYPKIFNRVVNRLHNFYS